MPIRYSSESNRFYDESNGRFVSASRGMRSSIARADYEQSLEDEPIPDEPIVEISDLPFEPAYGVEYDSRLGDEQFFLWGYGFDQGDIDDLDYWLDGYYGEYDIDESDDNDYE